MRKRISATLLVAAITSSGLSASFGVATTPPALPAADPVVVATFDTGTNPFHPCFRRPGLTNPSEVVANFPNTASPLNLTFASSYELSKAQSAASIDAVQDRKLYYIPGTNLTFYGGTEAKYQLRDTYPHGAQASSQIACDNFGMGANALLTIINWYYAPVEGPELIRWAADQAWIDIIHLNIQDIPALAFDAPEVRYAIAKGKMVVIAGGNGVAGLGPNYPMELSKWNGPPGSLIAGANDNGGYTIFSNLNPHVVMDGNETVAAAPSSFGTASFGGTSSASPRLTGYAARVLGALRREFGHSGQGLLTIPTGNSRPLSGPLADGYLTAAELHEAIRRTANPNPHASYYDGEGGPGSFWNAPQPFEAPAAVYAKMGYGEVSEHTVIQAIDLLAGRAAVLLRVEDAIYLASEAARLALWGDHREAGQGLRPLGVDPESGEGVIGLSAPAGPKEGERYSINTSAGQPVTIDMTYSSSAPEQDLDLFVFKGEDPSFDGSFVRKSTLPSGAAESIAFEAQGGIYTIVVLGWQVVVNQPFGLTVSLAPAFDGDDYYVTAFGSGF